MVSHKRFYGTGRRKTSVARVFLIPGTGKFLVNKKAVEDYFKVPTLQMVVMQPFEATGNLAKFDIFATLEGGGITGQAEALRHGVTRALLVVNPDYREPLRKNGFLTRDDRKKERKKYGHRGARRSTQYSKR